MTACMPFMAYFEEEPRLIDAYNRAQQQFLLHQALLSHRFTLALQPTAADDDDDDDDDCIWSRRKEDTAVIVR